MAAAGEGPKNQKEEELLARMDVMSSVFLYDEERLQVLMEDADVRLDMRGDDNATLLHRVITNERPGGEAQSLVVVNLLLAKALQLLESRDNKGQMPLHLAAGYSSLAIVKALVEAGAKMDVVDDLQGWTPLHFAVNDGSRSVIGYLLEHGADPDVLDKKNRKPEDLLSIRGDIEREAAAIRRLFTVLAKRPALEEGEAKSEGDAAVSQKATVFEDANTAQVLAADATQSI